MFEKLRRKVEQIRRSDDSGLVELKISDRQGALELVAKSGATPDKSGKFPLLYGTTARKNSKSIPWISFNIAEIEEKGARSHWVDIMIAWTKNDRSFYSVSLTKLYNGPRTLLSDSENFTSGVIIAIDQRRDSKGRVTSVDAELQGWKTPEVMRDNKLKLDSQSIKLERISAVVNGGRIKITLTELESLAGLAANLPDPQTETLVFPMIDGETKSEPLK